MLDKKGYRAQTKPRKAETTATADTHTHTRAVGADERDAAVAVDAKLEVLLGFFILV